MVFSSIPAYLDPSSLWQQQLQNQLQEQQQQQQQQLNHPTREPAAATAASNNNNSTFTNPLLLTPPPSLPLPSQPIASHHHHTQPQHRHASIISSSAPPLLLHPPTISIRPGSMAEKARMANIPPPARQLNCPRCHSADTKFCYYNNYSLTQPRHFCKGCRRYWTHGGAMRNVPVGGCKRNNNGSNSGGGKRGSKGGGGGGRSTSSNSKSSPATSDRSTGSTSSAIAASSFSGGGTVSRNMADILGLNHNVGQMMIPSTLRFMTMGPMHFGGEQHQFGFGAGFGAADQLGLTGYNNNNSGISAPMPINAATTSSGLQLHQLGGMADQWRMPQPPPSFPLFGGMDGSTTNNLYPLESGVHQMELSRLGGVATTTRPSLDSRELGPTSGTILDDPKMAEIVRNRHPSAAAHHHNQQREMDMNLTRQFHLGMNELSGHNNNQYSSWPVDGNGTSAGDVISDAWTTSSSSTVAVHANTTTAAAATHLSGLNSSSSTTGAI